MNSSTLERARPLFGARPFRSHRTFRLTAADRWSTLAALILGLLAAYVLLLFAWEPAMRFAAALTGSGAASAPDQYLGIAYGVAVPSMPALKESHMLWTAAACALAILAAALLQGQRLLKYWLVANLAVLGGSALYAFFNGSVGYDAAPFMTLVARTSLVTIAAAPLFLTLVSVLLPLSLIERILMIGAALACLFALAILRIAVFALLLGHFGSTPQANLYLFTGPLLDVLYFIAVYSVAVSFAGKRLARSQEAWLWL